MPHRRPAKKGSFSGHFDHLVDQLAHANTSRREGGEEQLKSKRQRKRSVHQILFEASHADPMR